jgi:hypothetical protein
MVLEMSLVEFNNPLNRTYTQKPCASKGDACQTGFLFCLVDLPFRNPQNCALGDHVTPHLGGNRINFEELTAAGSELAAQNNNYSYTFKFVGIPPVNLSNSIKRVVTKKNNKF